MSLKNTLRIIYTVLFIIVVIIGVLWTCHTDTAEPETERILDEDGRHGFGEAFDSTFDEVSDAIYRLDHPEMP